MLSVIQSVEPNTTIKPKDLFDARGSDDLGIGVLEAAVIFNLLGIPALAYSESSSTVPSPDKIFKDIWGLPKNYSFKPFLREATIGLQSIRNFMATKGFTAIVCRDLTFDPQEPVGHANVVAGYTAKHFILHESMSDKQHDNRPIPNVIIEDDVLLSEWHNHDYHTVVIGQPRPECRDRIIQYEIGLARRRGELIQARLLEKGIKYARL